MKKIKLLGALAIISMFILNFLVAENLDKRELSLNSLLKLRNAQAENLGDGWYTNFTMGTVWWKSGMTFGVTDKPFFSSTYTAYSCCLNSIDANSCNFNAEDPKCATIAVRAARS